MPLIDGLWVPADAGTIRSLWDARPLSLVYLFDGGEYLGGMLGPDGVKTALRLDDWKAKRMSDAIEGADLGLVVPVTVEVKPEHSFLIDDSEKLEIGCAVVNGEALAFVGASDGKPYLANVKATADRGPRIGYRSWRLLVDGAVAYVKASFD